MIYLMNATVVPLGANGIWHVSEISLNDARATLARITYTSAIGHDSTAAIMEKLLETEVPVNRIQVKPEVGDSLLCFKLNGRAPEGVIMSEEEIHEMGFSWVIMNYRGF